MQKQIAIVTFIIFISPITSLIVRYNDANSQNDIKNTIDNKIIEIQNQTTQPTQQNNTNNTTNNSNLGNSSNMNNKINTDNRSGRSRRSNNYSFDDPTQPVSNINTTNEYPYNILRQQRKIRSINSYKQLPSKANKRLYDIPNIKRRSFVKTRPVNFPDQYIGEHSLKWKKKYLDRNRQKFYTLISVGINIPLIPAKSNTSSAIFPDGLSFEGTNDEEAMLAKGHKIEINEDRVNKLKSSVTLSGTFGYKFNNKFSIEQDLIYFRSYINDTDFDSIIKTVTRNIPTGKITTDISNIDEKVLLHTKTIGFSPYVILSGTNIIFNMENQRSPIKPFVGGGYAYGLSVENKRGYFNHGFQVKAGMSYQLNKQFQISLNYNYLQLFKNLNYQSKVTLSYKGQVPTNTGFKKFVKDTYYLNHSADYRTHMIQISYRYSF